MNLGSQNVGIPGLALLKSMMAPPHPTTAAAFTTAHAPGIHEKASLQPTVSRYIGPKKSKFALRKQAEAEARAQKTASQQPEARQAPSEESGGIPEPTPLYLAQALAPPIRLPEPRRILVIMDLNGTLLYRPNKKNPFHFIERPHARQFMDYCLETFYVVIWSSARPQNVDKMVSQLLTPSQRAKCVVVWARDKFGLCSADYDSRVQCYKRLTSIWTDPAVLASHPSAHLGQRWDQTNTVLVDDSIEKARSEPHNILEIPEFSGPKTETVDVLPQVHDYLNLLCYQSDISRYMRQSPFKLDQNYRLGEPVLDQVPANDASQRRLE